MATWIVAAGESVQAAGSSSWRAGSRSRRLRSRGSRSTAAWCGGDALTTRDATLDGVDIDAGGACLVATEDASLTDVYCAPAGGAFSVVTDARNRLSTVVMNDVLVEGATASSLLSHVEASLTNVRFRDNTSTTGAGALEILDSTVVAERRDANTGPARNGASPTKKR